MLSFKRSCHPTLAPASVLDKNGFHVGPTLHLPNFSPHIRIYIYVYLYGGDREQTTESFVASFITLTNFVFQEHNTDTVGE